MLPLARKDGIVVQEIDGEVVIYDLHEDSAHTLNGTAALVWQACDGRTPVPEIAMQVSKALNQPIDDRVVLLALKQLRQSGLLEQAGTRLDFIGITRRAVLERIAAAGVASWLVPLVMSISTIPRPALALTSCAEQTGSCTGSCIAPATCKKISSGGTCGCV